MASVCFTDQGDCLRGLGRLDEAAAAYEETIRRAERLEDARESRRRKTPAWDRPHAAAPRPEAPCRLMTRPASGSRGSGNRAASRFLASDRHGAYQDAGQTEAAEDAYRKALAIEVRLGNVAGQANTLINSGICIMMS